MSTRADREATRQQVRKGCSEHWLERRLMDALAELDAYDSEGGVVDLLKRIAESSEGTRIDVSLLTDKYFRGR